MSNSTEQLTNDLTGIVGTLIEDTLSESNEVLAAQIANDAAECAAIGDRGQRGIAEVLGQAEAHAVAQDVKVNTAGWQAFEKVLGHVTAAAMASVKATKAELLDHLEAAWGMISNASGGDWDRPDQVPGWKDAAERWRDRYHELLK